MSEVEQKPMHIMAGYGQHESQWAKAFLNFKPYWLAPLMSKLERF